MNRASRPSSTAGDTRLEDARAVTLETTMPTVRVTTGATTGPAAVEPGPVAPPHTLTGRFHLLRDFRSRALGNSRDILVYLPPGYDDGDGGGGGGADDVGTTPGAGDGSPATRYPVLYMHDGQNLFDEVTAYGGQEWRLDETAEALIGAGLIAPIIIVGINHAGAARADELTPTVDPRRRTGGGGACYAQFVIDELKPYVDAHYRTRPDRDHTGTGGASLGGLIALYLGFSQPQVFGRIMAMSPSLWWDRRELLQRLRTDTRLLPLKIWLDAGTDEGGGTLQNLRMLKNALLRRGWRHGEDLRYVEAQGARHTEPAWAARAGAALEFLFPAVSAANDANETRG